jgi:hypothetical protein
VLGLPCRLCAMDLTLLHLAVPPRSTDLPPSPPRMGPGHRPCTRSHRCRRPAGHPHGAAAPEWTAASALGRPFSGPRSRRLHNSSRALNARPHRTAGDRAGGFGAEPLPPRRLRLGGRPDHCEREGIAFLAWFPWARAGSPRREEGAGGGRAAPPRRPRSPGPGCWGAPRWCCRSPAPPRVAYLEENLADAALRLDDDEECGLPGSMGDRPTPPPAARPTRDHAPAP